MDVEESVDQPIDHAEDGELVSRLRVIQEQPLADRASAYGLLYQDLQSRLEGADPS
ncbi:MAG: hypothetical protein ABI255_09140 [Microbacteriaceae bacterium]